MTADVKGHVTSKRIRGHNNERNRKQQS